MDSYNLINCGDNKQELIMGRLSYDECLRLIRFMCLFVEKQSRSNNHFINTGASSYFYDAINDANLI